MNEKPEALKLADEGYALRLAAHYEFVGCPNTAAELRRLHAENEALTATRDRQASMLRRLEEREAELDAEIGRLRDELRQSSIDSTRAEVERLRELLTEAREDVERLGPGLLLDRIDAALRRGET